MKKWDTVTVVGVGLIGGSIGLALRQRRLARRVIGVGRRAASLRWALQSGAVTETTTDLLQGATQAELVVVCTPVELIVEHVREAASVCPRGTIITDAGSTKARIVSALDKNLGQRKFGSGPSGRGVSFVGSHPLAGSEKTGVRAARDDFLKSRTVVVTPTQKTRAKALKAVTDFWSSLGAKVVKMTPQAHDRAVAASSHLPHLAAAALAAATSERDRVLAADGWLDTTRIAAGDVELWRQILCENRANVLKSLSKFEKVLASFRSALTRGDEAAIARLLETGKRHRDAVGD